MKFLRTPFLHSTASIVWEVEISSLCFLALINEPVFVSSHFVAQKLLFTKFVFFYANFIQVTTQYSFYCRQILKSKKNKNKKKRICPELHLNFLNWYPFFSVKQSNVVVRGSVLSSLTSRSFRDTCQIATAKAKLIKARL